MSHSVPSDSSTIEATFIVGVDLVEFDRHELPIYAAPERWMDACHDAAPGYGAPLDRVFGEPGDVHIDGVPVAAEEQAALAIAGDDPLVSLATLADGLAVADAAPAPELATSFDFGADMAAVILPADGAAWDFTGPDGTFDYQA